MANTFPEAFQREYKDSVYTLVKAMGNKFAGKTDEITFSGETVFLETMGNVSATTAPQGVGTATPLMEPAHSQRAISQVDHDIGLMIGKLDAAKTNVSFESRYVKQIVKALMRKRDIQVIKGALGTAITGKDLAGTAPFDFANQTIAVATGAGGATGMNVAKLRAIKAKFWANGYNDEKIYLALSGKQKADLLGELEIGSADYNTVKTNAEGDVIAFMGIEFVSTEYVPYILDAGGFNLNWDANDNPIDVDVNSTRACFAWVELAITVGRNPNMITRVSERDDLRYNFQAYGWEGCGAVRMEEAGVIAVPCLEV